MKASTLTRVLAMALPAALILTSPVLADDSHYRGGHVDHDYSYGGHVDHDYRNGGHMDHEYGTGWRAGHDRPYGGYGDHKYARPPYYGDGYSYGYDHPAGTRGYWGKDARHHRRGHRHHHGR